MKIVIMTTGGTIDKMYYDALSDFHIGEPAILEMLDRVAANFDYSHIELLKKDSLEISDDDRIKIVKAVLKQDSDRILITHGTDTMPETAKAILDSVTDKTVVITGSMLPARFKETDAEFNMGFALAATQTLPHGVYICMHSKIFNADNVQKNRNAGKFESKN